MNLVAAPKRRCYESARGVTAPHPAAVRGFVPPASNLRDALVSVIVLFTSLCMAVAIVGCDGAAKGPQA
jgi:hypothetical protein